METLQAVMEFIKQFATEYQTMLGGASVVLLTLYGFYQKYQNIIAWVTLRVEKDAQDGWTNDEKEQFAVDLYFTQLIPVLPLYLKWLGWLPKFVVEPAIRRLVKKLCAKTGTLQDNEPEIKPVG